MGKFNFGRRSLKELEGVHPELLRVAHRALELSDVDFGVHDGARTIEEQQELVRVGASKTMRSKHLPQSQDNLAHAMDLVPYVDGRLRWEWEPIFKIAAAVDEAAMELGVELRWGGVWDRIMSEYGGSPARMEKAVQAYCVRHPGPDFIDGPHFELA